jgi:hypothetical protein
LTLDQLKALVKKPLTRQFIEAWVRWRATGVVPRRSEMELRDIAGSLETIILFDYLGPDEIMLRVAGTRLGELSGIELTGKNYKDLTRPEYWPTRSRRIGAMLARPCGGIMYVRYVMANGRRLRFETVSLPLMADGQSEVRQLIACNTLVDGDFPPAGVRSQGIPGVEDFAFVDIGAGIPDDRLPEAG